MYSIELHNMVIKKTLQNNLHTASIFTKPTQVVPDKSLYWAEILYEKREIDGLRKQKHTTLKWRVM